jgi:large subunit ribosomal protein L6
VSIVSEDYKNLWWLVRTLINNMVEGVTKGFEKKLVVVWVGYSAKVQGKKIILNLGYSHPIEYELPEGISATVEKDQKWNDVITISGIDKQLVGQVAAVIRSFRKPEPYKGKGVRYIDEVVKLKAGKQAKK